MNKDRLVMYCATQRTGSTVMADDLLNITGGRPVNTERLLSEIIRNKPSTPWHDAWALTCKKNKVQHIIINKVMFHYTHMISRSIAGLPIDKISSVSRFEPALFDAFHEFFRDAVWVYVERRDVCAQAVSMHLAEKTGVWEIREAGQTRETPAEPEALYDSETLLRKLRSFLVERQQWQAFFAHYGIRPLRMVYEDAVANYPRYLDELVAVTGVIPLDPLPARRVFKVGDAINEVFVARLREEAQAAPDIRALLDA